VIHKNKGIKLNCRNIGTFCVVIMEFTLGVATEEDLLALVDLVQTCYRGDSSRKGWTTEADFLDGNRTTPRMMKSQLTTPGATTLKYTNQEGKIIGCVYTEHLKKDKKMYVGMLCIHPDFQSHGLGKKMMTAVDDLAKEKDCTAERMFVISQRLELIKWYEKIGFSHTGETEPFPAASEEFGIPKVPLEFIVLEKKL